MRDRLYYLLKPILPWRLRMAMRRWYAHRLQSRVLTDWPIMESAGRRPVGWKGWPQGAKFAFVLTHDVESQAGVDRVKELAKLEMSYGFRSAFNFIPEGGYEIPQSLIEWLGANGFEVGVHDLKHDGNLYSGREEFRARAKRINHYLRKWNAAGFRSGFMYHNLEWIHDIEVEYDASTFDNDPFEPQPDGVGTIFPFWVAAPPRSRIGGDGPERDGYVELPYTLPQDSTLFLVLRHQTPEVWLRKIEWLANQGGMALVNVHPDYVGNLVEGPSSRTYPVSHYAELLAKAASMRDSMWHALPRDVARWFRSNRPSSQSQEGGTARLGSDDTLRRKRASVLLYSCFPSDSRPRRAAEALVEAGTDVDVICLQEHPRRPSREVVNGVNVTRLPMQVRRGGLLTYAIQYVGFTLMSSALLTWRSLWRRYALVHVHNMPDFLVLAAWMPRLLGARILLDLHDPMPELFMTLRDKEADDRWIRTLCWIERLSIRFANLVVTPNESFRQRFVCRSGEKAKIHIVMNTPEEKIFHPLPRRTPIAGTAPVVLLYHGLIVPRHGLDLAVEALAIVRRNGGDAILEVYGAGNEYLESTLLRARELGVDDAIRVHGMVSESTIAEAIRDCDIGIVPNRYSPFIAINLPTRIFEFLAMERPVIVPRTQGISDYFGPDDLLYFQPDDPGSLAQQILWAAQNPKDLRDILQRGMQVYRRHRWADERRKFLELVAELLTPSTRMA